MKIAILTSGILPVPAVKGGAVENLIDFYLEYNDLHHLHDITIYSVADKATAHHPALQSTVNHYYYINVGSVMAKLRKHIFHKLHTHDDYYHYSIEYFLHEAIQHIRHQHYDLIVLENRPGYSLRLKNFITTAKLIYHLHNDNLNTTSQKYQDIYSAANRIITVSNFITNRIKTICFTDTKCVTVHNGINLKTFTPCSHLIHSSKDFTLIFSGRLIPEKGILPLIQAFKIITELQEPINIKLLILGSCSLGNNYQKTSFLQQLTKEAEKIGNITFTGYVDYAHISTYLSQADIAVLPSLWDEPFGLTCIEALAAGLPVITTKCGGIPEVVDDSCAILLDANDQLTTNLAHAIMDLYHNPEKRKAMSKAAIKRSKYFDKERYARDFFDALSLP